MAVRDFLEGYLGRKTVYSERRRIGYFRPDVTGSATAGVPGLCAGYIVLDRTGERSDPRTWTTLDFFGRHVPVTQFCLVRGVRPAWLTEAQKGEASIDPNTGRVVIPSLEPDKAGPVDLNALAPFLVAGLAGVAALAVLRR